MPVRDGLDQNISARGGFGRADDDRQLKGVCGEMIQESVAGPAADDVHAFHVSACYPFDFIQRFAVEQREAFQDAAKDWTGLARHRLAGFLAECLDLGRHVTRFQETRIVRVDQGLERRGGRGQVHHHVVIQVLFFLCPITAALLDDPKPGDVFEQAHRAAVADLVCEIQFAAEVRDDWFGHLDAHQRPGAGAQKGPVLAAGRQSRHRGGCVVGTGGDDLL